MKLLQVDSSVLGDLSVSRTLTDAITRNWLASHPGTEVERLDLAVDAPSHLNADALAIRFGTADASLTPSQRRENALTERLLAQFLAADVIVVGAPMYNFSIPSQLKAWIDRIAQAGRTFRYTDKGPVGLATGKTLFIASSRGGVYSEGVRAAMEHQESYLRTLFGFLGITDIRIVRAEGLAMGDEARRKALDAAHEVIERVTGGTSRIEAAALAA